MDYLELKPESMELKDKKSTIDKAINLVKKIKYLRTEKTKDLEKNLKKISDPEKIIEQFETTALN